MSHFTCLVVSQSPEGVDAALQPFHEYECTGTRDQYVVEVELDEEQLDALHLDHATSIGPKKSFAEYAAGRDYVLRADKVFRLTNPNSRWDWWAIGGRWPGQLLAKMEDETRLRRGEPSLLMTSLRGEDGYVYPLLACDAAMKSNLDIETMRELAGREARHRCDRVAKILSDHPDYKTWEDLIHIESVVERREIFHAQPAQELIRKEFGAFGDHGFVDRLRREGSDAIVAAERLGAPGCYAAIGRDGQWRSEGTMGWFGVDTHRKPESAWNAELGQIIDETPDDWWVTIVDCHI